jgi:hypothetical protein
MHKPVSPLVAAITIVLFVAGCLALYTNRYAISDWYYLRNYVPSPVVASLATDAHMTAKGRELFYRANPQIVTERATMVRYCSLSDNQVAELGCYLSTDHIYLLNISDAALKNEMITTAGYEMLHSAYQRMSDGQRRTIDAEMERVATQITDPDILSQIQIYAKTEPGARDDELYSVLGTEYPTLPPALQTEYAKYFTDRAQLVAYYHQFNQTFDVLHAQITLLGDQIKATKVTMQNYLANGAVSRYNSLVPGINAQITTYNQEVQLYDQYGNDILGKESSANPQ